MEILEMHPINEISPIFMLVLIVGVICLPCAIAAFIAEETKAGVAMSILVLMAIIAMFFNPPFPDTGKASYTVEITDTSKYQELIEKGYEFSRVYENRNIYIIKGDELE